jgi:hypothetical protein
VLRQHRVGYDAILLLHGKDRGTTMSRVSVHHILWCTDRDGSDDVFGLNEPVNDTVQLALDRHSFLFIYRPFATGETGRMKSSSLLFPDHPSTVLWLHKVSANHLSFLLLFLLFLPPTYSGAQKKIVFLFFLLPLKEG